ncbi:HNH endonuclease [Paenibacillus sp. GP183]|uniref:HNH endonuclease n=1 Tax=Paenibacillus sp. GP183 TaxID=1882751 RepID=UPI000899D67A|nr:HNH endonuclease [Paenibacillus sp. GP183]SEB67491.1 HNH endonuclease [Paenibacillus sp. GP183]
MRTMTIDQYNKLTQRMTYASSEAKGKIIFMHDVILSTPPNCAVIHKNGNGLDNRRENLELVKLID